MGPPPQLGQRSRAARPNSVRALCTVRSMPKYSSFQNAPSTGRARGSRPGTTCCTPEGCVVGAGHPARPAGRSGGMVGGRSPGAPAPVESGIVRLLRHGIQRARTAGAELEDQDESLLGSLGAFELGSRTRLIRAPEHVMPRGELNAAQALLALERSRHDLLDAAGQGNGLAEPLPMDPVRGAARGPPRRPGATYRYTAGGSIQSRWEAADVGRRRGMTATKL